MAYSHKGRVLKNGLIEPGSVVEDMRELSVRPEDDGLHIVDFRKGDFEWWYFDLRDRETGCFLKIVIHIGTDPLRTRIFPQLAVSVNTPEKSDTLTRTYTLDEIRADTDKCNITLGEDIQVRAEVTDRPTYTISIDVPDFKCNMRFIGSMEGWKPLGNEIVQQLGKKTGAFSWVIPVPRAVVEGDFYFEEKTYKVQNAVGYHDHNYIKVGAHKPLYLDELVTRWYWGKGYAGAYTVIFMDTFCRTNRLQSLMVSEGSHIIYSANNLIESSVVSYGLDPVLKTTYPERIHIKSTDPGIHFQAEFECTGISDRKDLLETVHSFARFLIRALFAKPAYHGIFTSMSLQIQENRLQGYGNLESMVFRGSK